jgi:CRP/FNR family transcriptional regulator, cyclic AMP receptor protein
VAKTDKAELLARVPLFQDLSKKELSALIGEAKEVSHREGAVLAKEGEQGLGFFLIVEGTAKVTVNGRTRRKLGPGDSFGEISLLDEGPRTATVTAETPIKLLGITSWVFKRLVTANPQVAMKMLKTLASILRSSSREVTG